MLNIKLYFPLYFLLLGITFLLSVFILKAEPQDLLAVIGSLTALVAIVFTQSNEIYKRTLEKEKFEHSKKSTINIETYKSLFDEKIKLYQDVNTSILEYRKELETVGSSYDDGDSQTGEWWIETVDLTDVYLSALKKILEQLHAKETLLSSNISLLLQDISKAYESKKVQYEEYSQIVAMDREDHENAFNIFSKSVMSETKEYFDILLKSIEEELSRVRHQLEF